MDQQLEFLEKLLCHRTGKRRTGGNAKPQLPQRRDVMHIAKRLIKDWRSRKHCCISAREISQHSARRSVAANDHRHTAHDQRREQITEAIRMRDRNHTKIQIGIANSHAIANLIAVGQQLLASKPNCTRRGRCT